LLALPLCLTAVGELDAQGLKPRTDEDRAAELLTTARRLVTQGDPAAAVSRLDTIARRYRKAPSAAAAALLTGQLYLANRELEDAFDAFQTVIERHAASPFFLEALAGQIETAQLCLEQQRTALRRGQRPDPDLPTPDIVADMFRLIVRNGRQTESAPGTQYSLSVALDQLNMPDDSISEHERFLRDYPGHPLADDAAYQLGNIRFHQTRRLNHEEGLLQSALLGFESFVATHPASERVPEAQARIGILRGWQREKLLAAAKHYERAGKRAAAALTLARILQEFPDSPDAADLAVKAQALSAPAQTESPDASSTPPAAATD